MNPVHFHLLFNHVAILSAVFSILIFSAGLIMSDRVLVRTAMIGFIFSALITIPVFLTGESAEDAVEDLPGVTHAIVHSHEEAAEFSIWMIEILGLISLVSLFAAEKFRRILTTLLVIFAIVATTTLIYTGMEGGKIRHSEIRGDGTAAEPAPIGHEEHD